MLIKRFRSYFIVLTLVLCSLMSRSAFGQYQFTGDMHRKYDSSLIFSLKDYEGSMIYVVSVPNAINMDSIVWIANEDTAHYFVEKGRILKDKNKDTIAYKKRGMIYFVKEAAEIEVAESKYLISYIDAVNKDTLTRLRFVYERKKKSYRLDLSVDTENQTSIACAILGLTDLHKRLTAKNPVVYLNLFWYHLNNFTYAISNANYVYYAIVPSFGYLFWVGVEYSLFL